MSYYGSKYHRRLSANGLLNLPLINTPITTSLPKGLPPGFTKLTPGAPVVIGKPDDLRFATPKKKIKVLGMELEPWQAYGGALLAVLLYRGYKNITKKKRRRK